MIVRTYRYSPRRLRRIPILIGTQSLTSGTPQDALHLFERRHAGGGAGEGIGREAARRAGELLELRHRLPGQDALPEGIAHFQELEDARPPPVAAAAALG